MTSGREFGFELREFLEAIARDNMRESRKLELGGRVKEVADTSETREDSKPSQNDSTAI
jgi:hypothetical protein